MATLLFPFAGQRTEAVTEKIINRFGSLNRALRASKSQLSLALGERDKDIADILTAAHALVEGALREEVTRSPVVADDPAMQRYFAIKFHGRANEELYAIFVDHEKGFISEDLVAYGDGNRVEARMAPIFRRALELGAAGFFLVHNHPSNNPNPSTEDINATIRIAQIAAAIDLKVFDHLIIAGNHVSSMREAGIL